MTFDAFIQQFTLKPGETYEERAERLQQLATGSLCGPGGIEEFARMVDRSHTPFDLKFETHASEPIDPAYFEALELEDKRWVKSRISNTGRTPSPVASPVVVATGPRIDERDGYYMDWLHFIGSGHRVVVLEVRFHKGHKTVTGDWIVVFDVNSTWHRQFLRAVFEAKVLTLQRPSGTDQRRLRLDNTDLSALRIALERLDPQVVPTKEPTPKALTPEALAESAAELTAKVKEALVELEQMEEHPHPGISGLLDDD